MGLPSGVMTYQKHTVRKRRIAQALPQVPVQHGLRIQVASILVGGQFQTGAWIFLQWPGATRHNALRRAHQRTAVTFQQHIVPVLPNVLKLVINLPTWCESIPSASRADTPECTGAGNGSPNWCYTIPVASRSYTPACASAGTRVADWCYTIPVADRFANPSCVGAGTESVPPFVAETACNVIPAFVRPIVGAILGCK